MIKSKAQEDAGNLVDLHTPLSDYDKLVLQNVYGQTPERKPVTRQPYDSLYVKLIRQRDSWNRN